MRIYGNRRIKTLSGDLTRPTLAKVREAIFNIWQSEVQEARWLDLCAGSGSMGAEALCHGAAKVVGIEKNPQACRIIKENWQQLASNDQDFLVLRGDVCKCLKKLAGDQFDLIYFDPPYGAQLYEIVLPAIIELGLLAPTGQLAVEYDPKCWQPKAIPQLSIFKEKKYGKSAIAFYCHPE